MFFLMASSAWNDSAIMDELAHIPAGYSYVRFGDMRLNPEHPPLIKDLAGLPLLALDLRFPTDHRAWKDEVNGQWEMGSVFLYESGNDPDQILRFARFPMMLFAIFFGWVFFLWARKHYGAATAIIALLFFAFSPTFLAHSKYVTTDLAASFGFFIGITTFLRFLNYPSYKNILIAGVGFGVAQLLKFSLFLLVPFYAAIALVWILISHFEHLERVPLQKRVIHHVKHGLRYFKKIILIGLIGLLLIAVVYQLHVLNYPVEKQVSDTTIILGSFGMRPLVDATVWMANTPPLRGFAYYMLGLLMVVQRAAGGNTTYFLGTILSGSWWYYFPVVYLVKETLAFHILTALAGILAAKKIFKSNNKTFKGLRQWTREHFITFSLLLFIAFYWIYSMQANLNIGVRHVLPTFPFLYLLVAKEIKEWVKGTIIVNPHTFGALIKSLYKLYIRPIPKYLFIAVIMLWIVTGMLNTWPGYLAYFNEITLFTMPGYEWAVDSNFDWGQDLKRLSIWAKENNIERVALHYFGGGSPTYYMGDIFEPWWSAKGAPEGYFAISGTILQGSRGEPARGFVQKKEDSYEWLTGIKPIGKAGDSIFIYNLPVTGIQ